ncbi:unnamed protein product [Phaeothamnion confervicola]
MSAMVALLGAFLLSLFVALLAALQLADYFGTGEEFILVMLAIMVFTGLAMAVFALVSAWTKQPRALGWTAAALAVLAAALVALPSLIETVASRSTNPFTVGIENTWIAIELLVPAFLAILIQWGLVRHRWLRLRGAEELTRWPWVTTVIAGLVVLNPFGLAVVGAALKYSVIDWLRDLWLMVAGIGTAVLVAMACIETYIRGRMLRKRLGPATPLIKETGA